MSHIDSSPFVKQSKNHSSSVATHTNIYRRVKRKKKTTKTKTKKNDSNKDRAKHIRRIHTSNALPRLHASLPFSSTWRWISLPSIISMNGSMGDDNNAWKCWGIGRGSVASRARRRRRPRGMPGYLPPVRCLHQSSLHNIRRYYTYILHTFFHTNKAVMINKQANKQSNEQRLEHCNNINDTGPTTKCPPT